MRFERPRGAVALMCRISVFMIRFRSLLSMRYGSSPSSFAFPVAAVLAVLVLLGNSRQNPLAGIEGSPWPEPSPQHKLLQRLVGEWEAHVQVFDAKDKPPTESPGTEIVRSTCQGLWYTVEIDCDKKGLPYQGRGILGYDPAKGRYTALWADVTSPLWAHSEGELSSDRNRITFTGEGPDPRNPQKIVKFRQELDVITKKNERKASLSFGGADGTEVKWMTVDYKLIKRR